MIDWPSVRGLKRTIGHVPSEKAAYLLEDNTSSHKNDYSHSRCNCDCQRIRRLVWISGRFFLQTTQRLADLGPGQSSELVVIDNDSFVLEGCCFSLGPSRLVSLDHILFLGCRDILFVQLPLLDLIFELVNSMERCSLE